MKTLRIKQGFTIIRSRITKIVTQRKGGGHTYKLLESLESDGSDNIDEVWINEALARYYQLSGEDVVDSESVIKEAKLKYK
jgi:hypothetical protein